MGSANRRWAGRTAVWVWLAFLGSGLAAGCQPVPGAPEKTSAPADMLIQIASNGWHTAVVLPVDDLPTGTIPEAADFPDARWLSFGWGDAEYFPARDPTVGMTLRAGLLPTSAVLLVGGLTAPPRETWPTAEILTLGISREGFHRLLDHLNATFDRAGDTRAQPTAPGLEPFSRFYPATGTFHAFNTCNTWTAEALQAAGLPVEPAGTITAEDLMAQLREIARR